MIRFSTTCCAWIRKSRAPVTGWEFEVPPQQLASSDTLTPQTTLPYLFLRFSLPPVNLHALNSF